MITIGRFVERRVAAQPVHAYASGCVATVFPLVRGHRYDDPIGWLMRL
ncbi:MAG TPA: hypothetical protein VFQ25_06115 [Ktedonobacterales bacterium]|nr:hypothetical protein [Ktedonobacterales bacterium]